MRTYRLAWVSLGAIFVLVLAGGVVHSTGSSLACPDWPLCYGSATPTMEAGIFYEHGHRLIGGLVGLLTAALAAALLVRWRPQRPALKRVGWVIYAVIAGQLALVGRLGVLASTAKAAGEATQIPVGILTITGVMFVTVLAATAWLGLRSKDRLAALGLALGEIVVFQATLGGVTVLLRLPTAVSTTHLATAMLFMVGTIYLVFQLRPSERAGSTLISRRGLAIAGGAVYVQMLLGALVRHTGAGLACNTDLFMCNAQWLPSTGPGWLLMAHRVFAFVVTGIVIGTTLPVLRAARAGGRPTVRVFSIAAHALVMIQVGLGLATVATYVSVSMASAHLMVGSLLLADLAALYLAAGPLGTAASLAAVGADSTPRKAA